MSLAGGLKLLDFRLILDIKQFSMSASGSSDIDNMVTWWARERGSPIVKLRVPGGGLNTGGGDSSLAAPSTNCHSDLPNTQ